MHTGNENKNSQAADPNTLIERQGSKQVVKYNNITYSMLDDNSIYTHMYWDFFLPLPLIFDNPRMLLIGLGGGTIPYQMKTVFDGKISIDIVEVNKKMIDIASEFLKLDMSQFSIYIEDGAEFVMRKKNSYDIIILDAYINDRIPKQFLEENFIANSYLALADRGILAINYAYRFSLFFEYHMYKKRLSKYFNIYALDKEMKSSNSILLCAKGLTKVGIKSAISSKMQISAENSFIADAYQKM
ncbi:MAG: spermidine synthase [Candidatus Micrarchaeia archaeon]